MRSAHPEHDDCARLAKAHRVPIMTVYESAMAAWQAAMKGKGEPTDG